MYHVYVSGSFLKFTFNFRYYKKFKIPDMERCSLPLEQSSITIAHANNTLIVSVSILIHMVTHNGISLAQYGSPISCSFACLHIRFFSASVGIHPSGYPKSPVHHSQTVGTTRFILGLQIFQITYTNTEEMLTVNFLKYQTPKKKEHPKFTFSPH